MEPTSRFHGSRRVLHLESDGNPILSHLGFSQLGCPFSDCQIVLCSFWVFVLSFSGEMETPLNQNNIQTQGTGTEPPSSSL